MPNKFKISAILAIATAAIAIHGNSFATPYYVYGTTLNIYAQSSEESTAHMIQTSKGLLNDAPHPWCGNRVYIDAKDTALFAAALSFSMTGKPANILYDDAKANRVIAGHNHTTCKLLSIF
jgi:hypothetical protein